MQTIANPTDGTRDKQTSKHTGEEGERERQKADKRPKTAVKADASPRGASEFVHA